MFAIPLLTIKFIGAPAPVAIRPRFRPRSPMSPHTRPAPVFSPIPLCAGKWKPATPRFPRPAQSGNSLLPPACPPRALPMLLILLVPPLIPWPSAGPMALPATGAIALTVLAIAVIHFQIAATPLWSTPLMLIIFVSALPTPAACTVTVQPKARSKLTSRRRLLVRSRPAARVLWCA